MNEVNLMDEPNPIIDVYEVRGDFGNVGNGRTLGIFLDATTASEHAKGCGSVDCGGDADVHSRKALSVGHNLYYLLEQSGPFELDVMGWSAAKDYHSPDNCLILQSCTNKIQTIRILRVELHLGLKEAKDVIDNLPYTIELSREGAQKLAVELVKACCTVTWKTVREDDVN